MGRKNGGFFWDIFFFTESIWKWIGAMQEDFFSFWLRPEIIEKNCSKMAKIRPIFEPSGRIV